MTEVNSPTVVDSEREVVSESVMTEPVITPPEQKDQADLLQIAELSSMEYWIPMIAEALPDGDTLDGRVALSDGVFEQKYANSASSVRVNLIQAVIGDLNRDDVSDAAVLLVLDLGGSGSFVHLAAVISENGNLKNTATALLGDRVKIERIELQDGVINVEMTRHAPDDPMCCPSEKVRQVFALEQDKLILSAEIPIE